MDRMHLTAAIPLFAMRTYLDNFIEFVKFKLYGNTFSIRRCPFDFETNSANDEYSTNWRGLSRLLNMIHSKFLYSQ